MGRNDPQFLKMAIKSDLMRVAQSAGRLTNLESYGVWMVFLRKALENMQKLPSGEVSQPILHDLKNLIQPEKDILYDARTRLKWAEKILDISCRLG